MKPRLIQLLPALLPLAAAAQDDAARACYLQGHRLATEGRYAEAAAQLGKVPAQDELHPYAARALLYSAWQSGEKELFLNSARQLAESADAGVAALATAALAEYQLCVLQQPDATAMAALRKLSAKNRELKPTLAWLEAEQMRLRGQLEAAASACREIESNHEYPLTVRHRARLILADIFFAKEDEAQRAGAGFVSTKTPRPDRAAAPDDDDEALPDDEEETLQTLEGKGEETLLTFITANPDSPLLEEAFRRLNAHRSFETSEYARAALNEWVQDTAEHKRRAGMALRTLQHLLNRDNAEDAPVDTSCAATAATALPQEPATALILLDQIRSLYLHGNLEEARRLLSALPETYPTAEAADCAELWHLLLHDPHDAEFDEAWARLQEREHTAALRETIRRNTFLHTIARGGAPQDAAQGDPKLILLGVRYILSVPLSIAQLGTLDQDLESIIRNPQADPETVLHARILQCRHQAPEQQRQTIRELKALHEREGGIPPHLLADYHRLLEEFYGKTLEEEEAREAMIAELQNEPALTAAPQETAMPLRMHLASLLVLSRKHREEARRLLRQVIAENPRGDQEPQALLLLAECTAQGNTVAALKEAVSLYERAAAHAGTETARQARIRRAALMVRLGLRREAADEMRRMLAQEKPGAEEEILARIVLSNALACGGTAEERAESMDCLEEMVDRLPATYPALPRAWEFMLLQTHATRCMRLGENERAMRSLEAILKKEPARFAAGPSDPEWHVLHHAAASAVQALIQLKQYGRAADLAERTAGCNKEKAPQNRARSFLEWAAYIRQEHGGHIPANN